ncbi:MAG: hypothetical protein JNL32_05760, partial [Candidatus Kapabacteria bacterium]|nr:hypothetical protein [Candidatus Kapabacteria bacterium]
MKYVLLIVVAFAASLFMWSCSSTTTTPAQSSVTIITDTVALNAGCFLPPVDDTVYIAQTDSTYLAWRAFRETRGACANAELPVVDFSKRCVVFFNMTTGSNVDYFITVSRNDDTKKINVLVQYIQYGSNTDPASKRGMYSIPRIPDGYILETKTEWLGIHDGRQSVTEILQSGTTEDLYDVVVVDTTTAYVVGANGTIRKSIDKGRTWIAQQSGVTTT